MLTWLSINNLGVFFIPIKVKSLFVKTVYCIGYRDFKRKEKSFYISQAVWSKRQEHFNGFSGNEKGEILHGNIFDMV